MTVNLKYVCDLGISTDAKSLTVAGKNYSHILGVNAEVDMLSNIHLLTVYGCGCTKIEVIKSIEGKDVVVILLVPLKSSLINLRIDYNKAGIHGGIVVEISNYRNNEVETDNIILNSILEGKSIRLGKLLKNCDKRIKRSKVNVSVSKLCKLLNICLNIIECLDKLAYRSVNTTEADLCKDLVNPLGKINVDITLKSVKKIFTEAAVSLNRRSDDSDVSRIANAYHIINVYRAADLLESVVNLDLGLCGLDNHNAGAYTKVDYSTLCISAGILYSYGIYACVGGCILACIGKTIGLYTCVKNVNFCRILKYGAVCKSNVDVTHGMGLTVILKESVVVYVAVCVNEINVSGVRNNGDHTADGLCIVNYVAEIKHVCDLSVYAVVKICLIISKDDFTIVCNAKEDVLYHSSEWCIVLAVVVCLSIKVIRVEIVPGKDVVAVSGCIKGKIYLFTIGINNHYACINRGIVVSVGYDTDYDVCANLRVTHIIIEGNSYIVGKLCKYVEDRIENVCADAKISDSCVNALCLSNKVCKSDTIGITCIYDAKVEKDLIKPLGKVNVYATLDRVKAGVAVKICVDTCRNNCGIGSEAGNVYRGGGNHIVNLVLLAIPLVKVVFNLGLGLRGLDYKRAHALTNVSDRAGLIIYDNKRVDGVCTGVCGCIAAYIVVTVGLYTYVVELNSVRKLKKIACIVANAVDLMSDNEVVFHIILCSIIILKMTIIVYISAIITEFYVKSLCHNYDGTCYGSRVIHLVAKVKNHCDLNICANVEVCGIGFKSNVTLDVNTNKDLADKRGCICKVAALTNRGSVCLSIKCTGCKIRVGYDVVVINLVPSKLCLDTVGIDGKYAYVESSFIVRICSNCADKVYANVRGKLTADSDLDICYIGRNAIKHCGKDAEVFLIICTTNNVEKSINSSLKLAESHRSAVCKADVKTCRCKNAIKHFKHGLKLLGKKKLNATNDTLNATVIAKTGNINAGDELNGLNVCGISNYGKLVKLVAVLNNLVVDSYGNRSLVNLKINGYRSRLIILVTREEDLNLVSAVICGKADNLCIKAEKLGAADKVALCIIYAICKESEKLCLGVAAVAYADTTVSADNAVKTKVSEGDYTAIGD